MPRRPGRGTLIESALPPMSSPSSWSPTSLTDVSVLAVGAGVAYAGLSDGRVLRSSDGRGEWQTVVDEGEGPPAALLAIPHALLLAHPGRLRRLAPDGRATAMAGLPEAADVVALALAGHVAVAGTQGHGVFRSEDDGATWSDANGGLPFRGAGLGVSGFAATGAGLFVAHTLGVSRSRDAGRAWETAGPGLPLRIDRLAVAASGPRLFAEADGRLFRLDGEAWTEHGPGAVGLLAADAHALYGLAPGGGLVWRAPDGGAWSAYDEGLPEAPLALALGAAWRLAALASGGLWRRPATAPPPTAPAPRLEAVPPFLTGAPAEVAFWLAAPAAVALTLVDGTGAEAARLADGPFAAGPHRVTVRTGGLPEGFYSCRLVAGDYAVSHPLAVLPGAG